MARKKKNSRRNAAKQQWAAAKEAGQATLADPTNIPVQGDHDPDYEEPGARTQHACCLHHGACVLAALGLARTTGSSADHACTTPLALSFLSDDNSDDDSGELECEPGVAAQRDAAAKRQRRGAEVERRLLRRVAARVTHGPGLRLGPTPSGRLVASLAAVVVCVAASSELSTAHCTASASRCAVHKT